MASHNEKLDVDPASSSQTSVKLGEAADVDHQSHDWTAAEEKAVRLKFDLTITPMVTLLYMCCAIDRSNIGNAKIEGMATELHLVGYRYNIVLSIFFIVYACVEVPSNTLLKRFGPRYYLPGLVFCFGLVSMCTAFVKSYAGLAVTRAILGAFEGGAMPATAFFLSCFYKKAELFFRMSIFIASSALANSFGGLLATALSLIPAWGASSATIVKWRNIFFFEGLLTMLIALSTVYFMPQSPGSWKFLTPRQRYIAGERIKREHDANPKEHVTWHHVRQAIFSVHTNVCAWCFFSTNSAVQGLGAFVPTILKEFGWTSTSSQLHSVPPYLVACVVTIALGLASDRTNRRGVFMLGGLVFSITGYGMLRFTDSIHAKYGAVFLCAIGVFAASSGFLSWGINNTGSPAVAAVAGGYMVTIGSLGGVLSTWTYLSKDSPDFHTGHSINFGLQLWCFCLAAFGIAHCRYENRMRAQGKRDYRLQGLSEEQVLALGHRHPHFRYME